MSVKIRHEIKKIERQIDGLFLHREAIDIQLNTSAAILEAKRIELALAETVFEQPGINFISIEEVL
jgi:hypothetical protein